MIVATTSTSTSTSTTHSDSATCLAALAGLVSQCRGGAALATAATCIVVMMSVLSRLAGGGGHLAELGRRQRMIQQGASRLLVLIVVLCIDERRCGRSLLVHSGHGRRIQRAQVAGDCGGASSSSQSSSTGAQFVHQAVCLDSVLQVRRGAARRCLGAVVHAERQRESQGVDSTN